VAQLTQSMSCTVGSADDLSSFQMGCVSGPFTSPWGVSLASQAQGATYLLGDRERDAVVHLAELEDLIVRPWLLGLELSFQLTTLFVTSRQAVRGPTWLQGNPMTLRPFDSYFSCSACRSLY
jgi:hypothetical protein